MTKASAPVSDYDRHTQFRARALDGLRERTINGRVVMVSILLAPAGSGLTPAHGTSAGYAEYLCRCERCSEAYSVYRQHLREQNLLYRKEVKGRMVSTLLGGKNSPKHGVVTGTYWYGCECKPCQQAKRDSRSQADTRAEYLTHLVPREDDGVLVSTLLGTEGYPEHGTYVGADWYGCWCEQCRWAKNTVARLYYLLRRDWPGRPARGAVSALSRAIVAVWSGSLPAAREQIVQLLRDHPVWAATDLIEDEADKLANTLAGNKKERAA